MSFDTNTIIKAVEEAKTKAKKRRFVQSYELIIRLKDYDIKNQANRFSVTLTLPHALPEKVPRVCAIVSGSMVIAARDAKADIVLTREDVEKLSGNKKEIRKLASSCDYFIASPDLMVLIGKAMGQILGPRNKMPEVVQPNADIKAVIERLRRSVRIRIKDQPQIQCRVGTETMDPKAVTENIMTVLDEVIRRVTMDHIDSIIIKLTMGEPIVVKPNQ